MVSESTIKEVQRAEKEQSQDAAVQNEHILQFFAYAHLPYHLQQISKPFSDTANWLLLAVPRNPERTVALRKLLEAKDAAVRAMVAK